MVVFSIIAIFWFLAGFLSALDFVRRNTDCGFPELMICIGAGLVGLLNILIIWSITMEPVVFFKKYEKKEE